MPAPQAAPAQAAAPPGPAQEENTAVKAVLNVLKQMFIGWVLMQVLSKFFAPKPTAPTPPVPAPSPASSQGSGGQGAPNTPAAMTQAFPAWPLGIPLSMHVYITTSPQGDVFSANAARERDSLPHFVWDNITFGDWTDSRTVEYEVNLPELKVRKEHNLLGSHEEAEVEEAGEQPGDIITSHWHSNLTIGLVSDAVPVPVTQLPAPVAQYITLLPERDETGTKGFYRPIIFPNDFWHLRSQYIEINTTTPTLPLQVTFQPMSYWKFQLFATMTYSFQEAAKQQGATGSAEMDEIKRMLVETNPWFLGLTGLVSILHVVFEMLAFSSDVSHWRKKQELVGVSVRTIVTNVVVQIIILLYLIDNNEQTSWMVLMGSGVGVVIEAWKITKAVDISLVSAPAGSLLPYKLDIKGPRPLSLFRSVVFGH
ncbi:hypothetical protein EIP86_010146 [Pleurotus ostreatoroseus]|nr:hypothetical protein EIP86_010146 [Pleurotus ostreatoroseus]